MIKRRYTTPLLILILLLSGAFLLYGLHWDDDLRGYPHPDERHLANTMGRVSIPRPVDWGTLLNDPDRSPLNPRRLIPGTDAHYDLAYGTLPIYLYRAVAVALARVTGDPQIDTYTAYRTIGRAITALFSLLVLLWAFYIGRRTFGVPAALLGTALLGACVLHIQLSHFMTVDLMMSAMLAAGLLLATRFAQGGRTVDALAMGLLMGLSMACKFNGITLGAGVAAAYGVAWLGGKRTLKDLLSYCLPLTFIGWALAFTAFEYYAVRDPYTYARAIGIQAEMVSGETDWPYTRQYVNTAPYLYQLRNLVVWGMGWPLGVASGGGIVVTLIGLAIDLWRTGKGEPRRHGEHGGLCRSAPRREGRLPRRWESEHSWDGHRKDSKILRGLRAFVANLRAWLQRWAADPRRAGMLVLLGWAVPFFAYTAQLEVKFLRYMLPLTPVLCLFAADLLWRSGGLLSVARRSSLLVSLRWGLVVVVFLPTALWALAYMRVYAQEHPWQAGSRWFYRHALPGSAYTWEAWGDPLPVDLPSLGLYRDEHGYRDVWMRIYADLPPRDKVGHIADSLRQADYVVFSTPRIYLSVARLPWRYPVEIRYYQLLFTGWLGYELAAKFTAFPGLGSWEVNDLNADQSFYDYEHPPVLIFRKTRDLSDQEWQALFAEQLEADPQITREGDELPVQLPMP